MKVKGKVILVTGAGSGLGKDTALHLIESGAFVIAIDLDQTSGAFYAQNFGDRSLFQAADVCDENAVQRAIDAGVARFGAIHGCINCAGVGRPTRVISGKGKVHLLKDFEFVVKVNVFGSFNVLRLSALQMSKQDLQDDDGRGVIINTASVAAFDGQIGQASYSASKAAIAGMTLPLARDLAKWGIRVVTIAPGIFETPMMAALPEKTRESLSKQVPFPARLGKPREYSQMCISVFENAYLNGETIRLDGSIRMAAM